MNQYIPQLEELDLQTEQLTNEWKGVNHHIGPVQQSTSLLRMLQGKTTCATATVISGVLLWGAKRLQPFVNEEPLNNVNFLNEMAEALFAWQHDTLYLDTNQLPDCGYNSMPDFPVENSASLSLLNFPAKSINDYWCSFHQPTDELAHMIYILRFILPKKSKKEFTKWLKSTVVRLDGIALSPWIDQPDYSDFDSEEDYCLYCKPRFGKPLPPLVLNSMIDGTSINWEYESKKFLASLDYSKNRYLRSPKEMKKMGFKGEPYKL